MSMSPENGGEPWTDADRDRLAIMYFTVPRMPIDEMAAALGRTTTSVFTEICRMGMSKPGARLRPCLPCGRKLFFSCQIGNRICRRCVRIHQRECA
jgi:hypothetical protein